MRDMPYKILMSGLSALVVVLALPFIVGPFMPKLPPLPHRYSVTNEVGRKYTVEVIDGCEYLDYDRSITHKGNCTNTIHAR